MTETFCEPSHHFTSTPPNSLTSSSISDPDHLLGPWHFLQYDLLKVGVHNWVSSLTHRGLHNFQSTPSPYWYLMDGPMILVIGIIYYLFPLSALSCISTSNNDSMPSHGPFVWPSKPVHELLRHALSRQWLSRQSLQSVFCSHKHMSLTSEYIQPLHGGLFLLKSSVTAFLLLFSITVSRPFSKDQSLSRYLVFSSKHPSTPSSRSGQNVLFALSFLRKGWMTAREWLLSDLGKAWPPIFMHPPKGAFCSLQPSTDWQ